MRPRCCSGPPTRRPPSRASCSLREAERDGLIDWLAQSVGPVATAVFGMDASGRIPDAVPFGLVVRGALRGSGWARATQATLLAATVRGEERYLGGFDPWQARRCSGRSARRPNPWSPGGPTTGTRRKARSCASGRGGSSPSSAATVTAAQPWSDRSRVLEAGLDARLAALRFAGAEPMLSATRPRSAGGDARPVRGRAAPGAGARPRRRDRDAEIRAAEASVRLARWLALPEEPPATLTDGATRMLRSWGWADRALALLDRADTSRVPQLGDAYAALWAQVRLRRAALDDAFARKLAAWTEAGSETDLICVENLLERIARPVAARRLPVIVVLDGMSVAVACELAEEITGAAPGKRRGAARTAASRPSPRCHRLPGSPGLAC